MRKRTTSEGAAGRELVLQTLQTAPCAGHLRGRAPMSLLCRGHRTEPAAVPWAREAGVPQAPDTCYLVSALLLAHCDPG